jgi:hypothetical protein
VLSTWNIARSLIAIDRSVVAPQREASSSDRPVSRPSSSKPTS